MADMQQETKTEDTSVKGTLPPLDRKFFEVDRASISAAPLAAAGTTSLGDTFSTRGSLWVNRGWYSAVHHVAGESESGQRTVISHHEQVAIVRRASDVEAEEAFSGAPREEKKE
jgi:hypothetical protein